ncbi:aromatic ring-hydroxylating dioxygenase subunit alpha [Actinocrinis sp.]|uniref:aromatic ring-hydroxylating dioxygenase subunit alpha n=1 Tax=Actinocrinis sp. TaxID=1920516 RepID=UPI002C04564C|nr:aromatic ring-hydroxylating dioxygenase subunit alpha [Actinocrinis sp.]HXR72254.1 aromatic ring-hydroxylating dioxygenase subunit alpha [Actinocrinis sp.]
MIPNQWYPILLPEDVTNDKPTGVRRMGQNLVVWRDIDGNLVCQDARCPHKGANLGDGRLKGNSVECRYHGFRYGPDGNCVAIPALGSDARIPATLSIQRYPVREVNGLIWLWWGDERPEHELPDVQIPSEVADNPRLHATMHWTRPVHYTRYIESVLEFYHVTYVHRDHWFNYVDYLFLYGTLRKFGLDGRERYLAATKVENSHLEVDGQTLRYSFDHVEEEDPTNTNHYDVTFTFPSMSHIVSKQFEVTAWFAPIDDEHTEIFLRWYEFPRLKGVLRNDRLRRLVPRLSLYMEKWVQDPQDVRVLLGQEPKVSERGVSKFIPVDELNAKYVSMRTKLLQEAAAAGSAGTRSSAAGNRALNRGETSPSGSSGDGSTNGAAAKNGAARKNGAVNGASPAKAKAANGSNGAAGVTHDSEQPAAAASAH